MFKITKQRIADVFPDGYFKRSESITTYFDKFPYVSKVDQIIYAYNNPIHQVPTKTETVLDHITMNGDHDKFVEVVEKRIRGYDVETIFKMNEMMFQTTFLNVMSSYLNPDPLIGKHLTSEIPLVHKDGVKYVSDVIAPHKCKYADVVMVYDGIVYLYELKYIGLKGIGNDRLGVSVWSGLKNSGPKSNLHIREFGAQYLRKWRSVANTPTLDIFGEKDIKTVNEYFKMHVSGKRGTIDQQLGTYRRLLMDQHSRRPPQLNLRKLRKLKDISGSDIRCFGVVGIVDRVFVKEYTIDYSKVTPQP